MPKSPLTSFIDSLLSALTVAAQDVVEDFIDQNQSTLPLPPPHTGFPGNQQEKRRGKGKAKGQATGGRRKAQGAKVPRPDKVAELTLYDELEVSRGASEETISAAFRSLSKKYHPDSYVHETGSRKWEEKYKRITHAWSVLKDHGKKKEYDRQLRAEEKG